MLAKSFRIYSNPWDDTVPNGRLIEIVDFVATKRAEHVEKMHSAGTYSRDSLGLVFLDPSALLGEPTDSTLLATIAIGPEGERFIRNAAAKAFYHRDHGQPAGYGVYVDLTQSRDGDFCYGFSTQVDGTIAAASSQTELQDSMEAGHAAVTLNHLIRSARKEWFDSRTDRPGWFDHHDMPHLRYELGLKQTDPIYDSDSSS